MIKTISPAEYESVLREICGLNIVEFFYITDRILVFNAGIKIDSPIDKEPNNNSTEKRYEYELWIDGDWDYLKDGKIIETSKVKDDEDAIKFRKRIQVFADNLKPKTFTNISLSKDGLSVELTLCNGGQFRVNKDEEMFVHIYRKTIAGGTYESHGVDVDEDTFELKYFENTKILSE